MKKILVTGAGGPAGKSVIALLRERNYDIVAVDMQPLVLEGIPFFQVPPARHPDFLSRVEQIARQNRVDFILPTVSEELTVFASGWTAHSELPIVVGPAVGVDTANDKYLTALTLAARGIPIPHFMLPSEAETVLDIERRIGWPCISKPRVGRGGREVHLVHPQDFEQIKPLGDRYILQEFAPGVEYDPNVYLGPDQQGVVVVLEKTALKEGIVGNALSVRRVTARDVAETALAAGRALSLRGPLDIDMRRNADGVPVVLEINARFGANIRSAPEVFEALLSQMESI